MIYILEDDASILELIVYALTSQNIPAKGFAHPEEFFKSLTQEVPKILVLDVMLPEISGFDILKQIKQDPKTKMISVIMLSALGQESDKVKGLELGADDYLSKPFGMMEFIARIRAILRRYESAEHNEIVCGDLTLSFHKREAIYQKQTLPLTFKEFELLGLLLKNKDRAFSRNELLEHIWGYSYSGENRTIDIHIKTLRQKLGDFGKHIKTIRNIGYKFSQEEQ